jgi:hypothetical protein
MDRKRRAAHDCHPGLVAKERRGGTHLPAVLQTFSLRSRPRRRDGPVSKSNRRVGPAHHAYQVDRSGWWAGPTLRGYNISVLKLLKRDEAPIFRLRSNIACRSGFSRDGTGDSRLKPLLQVDGGRLVQLFWICSNPPVVSLNVFGFATTLLCANLFTPGRYSPLTSPLTSPLRRPFR